MTLMTQIASYKKDSVVSAPKEKLIVMLYESALRNFQQALFRLERNDRARFGMHLGRGQAIVSELLSSLDHEQGGKIAKDLEKLYLFVIDRLIAANLKREAKGLHDSIRIMKTLKEGWDHAYEQSGKI